MKPLLTINEAAAQLHTRHETLRRLIARGEIEAVNIGGSGQRRSLRIRPEAIETFVQSRSTRQGQQLPPGLAAKLEAARRAKAEQ